VALGTVSSGTPAVLTEVSSGPPSPQANTGTVGPPRLGYNRVFKILSNSSVIQPFDTVECRYWPLRKIKHKKRSLTQLLSGNVNTRRSR
jgi:hypothetical protein